jgi:hypothetical protein
VPETCRELKNRINKSIKSGASSWFSARNRSPLLVPILREISSVHALAAYLFEIHPSQAACPRPRFCLTFSNTSIVYGEDLPAVGPPPKLASCRLLALCGCFKYVMLKLTIESKCVRTEVMIAVIREN